MRLSATLKDPRINWTLRFAVSALTLGILICVLPREELWSALRNASLSIWLTVLCFFLFGHVVAASKWWLMISRDGDIPLIMAIRAHFAGLVANLCLPGVAGGDVIRAGWVMKSSDAPERVAIASVADRLIDCFGLLLIACFGAIWSLRSADELRMPLIVSACVVLIGVIGFLVVRRLLSRFAKAGLLRRIADALNEVTSRPGRLAVCLALSIAVQTMFVALNFLLGSSVGIDVAVTAWAVAWPLSKLIAIVPISLAGLGVREGLLVAFLRPFGAEAGLVVGAGILWQTILLAGGLSGLLVILATGQLSHQWANGKLK